MYKRELCVVIVLVRLVIIIIIAVYLFEIFLPIFVVSRVLMIINFQIHWYVNELFKQIPCSQIIVKRNSIHTTCYLTISKLCSSFSFVL